MTGTNDRYRVRRGRTSDAAELARLHGSVQLQAATGGRPHPGITAWVEDLMAGHPSVEPDHFLVAEDLATGRTAASLVGLRQDWTLAGVRMPVIQVELVGTAPEHRGNRLTEKLFATLHQRCADEDVPLQVIEGIPYFYRRLGYDYALANDGAATVPATALPTTGQDRPDGAGGSRVRPATVADAGDLADIDGRLADGEALVCPRDDEAWRYEIAGRSPADVARRTVAVVRHGDDVEGYLVHTARLSTAGELTVVAAACRRPAEWPRVAAALHAYLGHTGRRFEASAGQPFTGVRLLLDPQHPLARLGPPGVPKRPRGWYARTGDPVDLLARLLPVLRGRWRAAGLRWHEPTLTVDLYGRAARLEFVDGEPAAVRSVRGAISPSTDPGTHAAVPPAALLHLALGHRTLPEVLDAWPDCLLRDRRTEEFLTAAFPRVPVRVWPRG